MDGIRFILGKSAKTVWRLGLGSLQCGQNFPFLVSSHDCKYNIAWLWGNQWQNFPFSV